MKYLTYSEMLQGMQHSMVSKSPVTVAPHYHYILYFNCTGINIQRSNGVFTVGKNATLTCSSDLSVTSTEWLYNFQVVKSSASSGLRLMFNPVNDNIHGNEYTCRITTPYGIQEQTVQLIVQGKLNIEDLDDHLISCTCVCCSSSQ